MKKAALCFFTLIMSVGFFAGASPFVQEDSKPVGKTAQASGGETLAATVMTQALSAAQIDAVLNFNINSPQSIIYVGNDTLVIADTEAIKKKNITTGAVEILIEIGSDAGKIPFSDELSFDADTDDIYIKEYDKNIVRKYNLGNAAAPAVVPDGTVIPAFNSALEDYFGNTINRPESNAQYPVTCDRYNGMLYYIKNDGTEKIIRHEAATVGNPAAAMWTFAGRENEHFDWKNKNPVVGEDELYIKTDKEVTLYEFPFGINAAAKIKADTNLISLNNKVTFDGMTDEFDGWEYVLYSSPNGTAKTGYVRKADAPKVAVYSVSDLTQSAVVNFEYNAKQVFYGRVIRNNVPIYKYPTSIDLDLIYPEQLSKTEQARENETCVKIERLITVPDIRGWYYFEVKVIGTLTDNFKYYGYVATNYIIDMNAKSEYLRIVDNAQIIASPGERIKVYADAALTQEIEGEYLTDGLRVRAIDYNNSAKATKIMYSDPLIGNWHHIDCYVATVYVAPDSLTSSQWVGVIIFSAMIAGGVIFLIKCLLPKKKKKVIEKQAVTAAKA